jgi:four helix bundle protein
MDNDNLIDRLFNFAVAVLKYLKGLDSSIQSNTISFQLSKSSTSAGANYEESQGASSKKDFHNKVRIALKEMRESNYWLRIPRAISSDEDRELDRLVDESDQLKKILGKISSKVGKELDA